MVSRLPNTCYIQTCTFTFLWKSYLFKVFLLLCNSVWNAAWYSLLWGEKKFFYNNCLFLITGKRTQFNTWHKYSYPWFLLFHKIQYSNSDFLFLANLYNFGMPFTQNYTVFHFFELEVMILAGGIFATAFEKNFQKIAWRRLRINKGLSLIINQIHKKTKISILICTHYMHAMKFWVFDTYFQS